MQERFKELLQRARRIDELLNLSTHSGESWRDLDRELTHLIADLKQLQQRQGLVSESLQEIARVYEIRLRELTYFMRIIDFLNGTLFTDEIFDHLPALIRDTFDADSASIMLLDEANGTLEIVGSDLGEDEEPREGVSIPLGEGISGWVARHGRSWLMRDAERDMQFKEFPGTSTPVASMIAVPIVLKDHLMGVINLGSRSVNAFTLHDERLLSVMGGMVAIAIGNARFYEELEERIRNQNQKLAEVRDFLQSIINTSDDVIMVFDRFNKILFLSPSVEKYFGFTTTELQEQEITRFISDEERLRELLEILEKGEEVRDRDLDIPHRNGTTVPCSISMAAMKSRRGQIVGFLANIRNIEKRTQLYRELAKVNERLRLLFDASQKITSSLDINEVLTTIVNSTLSLLDADTATLLLFNQETGVLEPAVHVGDDQHTAARPEDSALGVVARQGKALTLESPQQVQQFFPEIDPRITSKIVIPLMVKEKILGVLDINSRRPERRFQLDDQALAGSFAQQAALALDNAHLYNLASVERQRLQDLLKLSRSLTPQLSLNEAAELFARHTTQVMDIAGCLVFQQVGEEFQCIGTAFSGRREEPPSVRIKNTDLSAALRTGKIREVEDPAALGLKSTRRRNPWRASAFPIADQNRRFGVLVVLTNSIVQLTSEDEDYILVIILQMLSFFVNLELNAEVVKTKNHLEDLIASSVDAIITTDRRGRITLYSHGAEKMFGYRADSVMGRKVTDFYIDRERVVTFLRHYLRRGVNPPPHELEMKCRNGRKKFVSLSVSWLRNETGEIVGSLGIAKDISERRRLEEESLKAMQLATLTQTAVTLNDQINNPLGVILSQAELMLITDPPVTKEQKRALKTISEQVLNIQRIIRKLQKISRPIMTTYALEGGTMIDLERSEAHNTRKRKKNG